MATTKTPVAILNRKCYLTLGYKNYGAVYNFSVHMAAHEF